MLADPVFNAITSYKKEHRGDVIRHELAIRAEILRCKQYRQYAITDSQRFLIDGIVKILIEDLNNVLGLLPAYLDHQFKKQVRKTKFWERGSLKANCLNWKYVFYTTQRHAVALELTGLLKDKAKVTPRQVKESTT